MTHLTQASFPRLAFFMACGVSISSSLWAQPPGARRPDNRQQQDLEQQQQRIHQHVKEVAVSESDVPSDPQLLALHKEFVSKAEKLALEYERKKQFDKAREVYSSMVRLSPSYTNAEAGLGRTLSNQTVQDKQLTTIVATQAWQDSGVSLVAGMPVHTETKGTWKVVYETDASGIDIPEEFRPRDGRIKLGTLIAVVANTPAELAEGKPFVLDGDFIAKKSGRLYLRMFDVDPTDNEGKMIVLIQSTFQK